MSTSSGRRVSTLLAQLLSLSTAANSQGALKWIKSTWWRVRVNPTAFMAQREPPLPTRTAPMCSNSRNPLTTVPNQNPISWNRSMGQGERWLSLLRRSNLPSSSAAPPTPERVSTDATIRWCFKDQTLKEFQCNKRIVLQFQMLLVGSSSYNRSPAAQDQTMETSSSSASAAPISPSDTSKDSAYGSVHGPAQDSNWSNHVNQQQTNYSAGFHPIPYQPPAGPIYPQKFRSGLISPTASHHHHHSGGGMQQQSHSPSSHTPGSFHSPVQYWRAKLTLTIKLTINFVNICALSCRRRLLHQVSTKTITSYHVSFFSPHIILSFLSFWLIVSQEMVSTFATITNNFFLQSWIF